MNLSDEQMAAARHGLAGDRTWEAVALPIGPQPLPPWAKGLHIDWMDKWSNPPRYIIKADRELRDWENKVFVKEGSRYMAVTPDGRAEVYYHEGRVSRGTALRWENGGRRRVEVQGWVTTQQEGFGGSHFPVFLAAADEPQLVGQTVYLRGPWHGGAPHGFVECSYHAPAAWRGPHRPGSRWWRPWWQQTAVGGLFITEDLWRRLVARFWPHVTAARVTDAKWNTNRLEAVREGWHAPKDWMRGRHLP